LKYIFLGLSLILTVSSCSTDSKDLLEIRYANIKTALESDIPIITLSDSEEMSATNQKNVFKDEKLKAMCFDPATGKPMLNEVLTISKVRPADITPKIEVCKNSECLRLEVYNFALNGTGIFFVKKEDNKLLDYQFYPTMQGDINEELANLATYIAVHDSTVIAQFEGEPAAESVRMSATKTALNRTKCQRSQHLCIAPTFVKGDKALWVIVDLTELRVAGTKWTSVGTTGMAITERAAQNDYVMSCFCDKENSFKDDNWSYKYNLTRSDGLKIYDIAYKGKPTIKSVKLVDWHVSYSKTEGFGYSDAIGCPEFSQSAVVAVEAPYFEPIVEKNDTVGFAMIQKYFSDGWPTPCSYNYQQEFQFYTDGRFRPMMGSIGRGCGNDGTYRPVTRISFFSDDAEFLTAKDNSVDVWQKEGWVLEDDTYHYIDKDYLAQIKLGENTGYMMEANKGQFGATSRGDNAYIYVTVDHGDGGEGESDLPTLAPCCNNNYEQGPEKFINGESLLNKSLVLWYVPQMKNDDTPGQKYCWAESVLENGIYVPKVYPCFSGPMFVPM